MKKANKHKVKEIQDILLSNKSIKDDIKELLHYLPYCEYELILFMIAKKVWQGPKPQPPEGFKKGEGNPELGVYLYWLNNPELLHPEKLSKKEQEIFWAIIVTLELLLPDTQMTAVNYNYFSANELIYTDGLVLSTTVKYAAFDQGWGIAFFNLIQTILYDLWYSGDNVPPTSNAPVINLKGTASNKINIAILGDWGTGQPAAGAVMNQLTKLTPDYIIHVGDVYYAGTPLATDKNGSHYFSPGEENNNMVNIWPQQYSGKSFTLNSNHEMYCGANGFYYDALGWSGTFPFSKTPFKSQNGSGCFALKFGGWTLLGLDSAYMSSITNAFMIGSIGGANGVQGKWIQQLGLDPKKTIVLTHHNGITPDSAAIMPLWAEIKGALNGDPYAWYWGHVHNAIVYTYPVAILPDAQLPIISLNTYARCVGHAAIPYGPSSALDHRPIAWREASLQPPPSRQLYNGFAMLTLTLNGNGQVASITENFFDPRKTTSVWTKEIFRA